MESSEKRSHIERVAFDLFLNTGYDATSIRMICRKVEIDPPTLYHFYGSKKGLFFAITKDLLEHFATDGEPYNHLLQALPPEMQLYSIFSASIRFAVEHVEETRFYFRYSLFCPSELQEEVRALLQHSQEAKQQAVDALLNECIQKNRIGIDAEQAASYFWNFVKNNSFNVVFDHWRPSREELLTLWKTFFKCMLKGSENVI